MTDAPELLPSEIQAWRDRDTLDHIGNWATTRYPTEAVTYVRKADAELAVSEAIRRAAERVMAARMGDADSDLRSILHCIEALAPADALAEVQRLRDERDAALARVEKLREALTPSGDTKATYMGEFSFMIADFDENGEEMDRKVYVPWDQIKEIMAAILARAALDEDARHG